MPTRPIIGVVHRDEGSAYGVSFPDAPSCFAAADDLDGLIPAAVEALTLWAEKGGCPLRGTWRRSAPRWRTSSREERPSSRCRWWCGRTSRGGSTSRSAFLAEAALNEIEARH